jgi:CRISPR type III-B/RAMP module RAMP protein Cmr6
LPGSAVKGVARSYALQDLASRLGKGWQRVLPKTHRNHDGPLGQLEGLLLEETLKEFETKFPEASAEAKTIARQFRAIFGRTDEAGLAIFFDAVPKDDPKLGLDLINPHYPNYYREDGEKRNSPPTNWQSPKPVFFLALQPKVTFGFAVGWRASVEDSLRKQAKDWLAGGLTEMGLGAKTSAGYGYFVARGQGNGNRSATTPQGEQKAATGRVRYEGGKPVVVITPTQGDAIRIRVHKPWKEWGFASDVGDKTDVTIVYEETAEGKRTLISIKRK